MQTHPFTLDELELMSAQFHRIIHSNQMQEFWRPRILAGIAGALGAKESDMEKIKAKLDQSMRDDEEEIDSLRIIHGKILQLKKDLVQSTLDREISDSLKSSNDG